MRCLPLLRCAVVAALLGLGAGQTFTDCDPTKKDCDPNPALGPTIDVDFTTRNNTGPFDVLEGNKVETNSDEGALFVIRREMHAPTIVLPEYIFFGRLEVVLRASGGTGVVTSVVLQSDVLDEIDMEWLGGDNAQFQSNYFRKGDDSTYDRGAYHPVEDPVGEYHNYTIDWNRERIRWLVDGTIVRELTAAESSEGDRYPQTPMRVKIGTWVAGRKDASQGIIDWAGGITDFDDSPFTAYVQRIRVVDSANGVENATEYVYTDRNGDWESIEVKTGERNPDLIDDDTEDDDNNSSNDNGTTDNSTTDTRPIDNPPTDNPPTDETDGDTSPASSSGGFGPGAIAGIVIGAVAACVIIGVVSFFLGRRHKREKSDGHNISPEDPPTGAKSELDGRPREKPDADTLYIVPAEPPQELDGQWTMRAQKSELGGRELAAELQGHEERRF